MSLCGKYIGDNDATCPQLTCIREIGHPGFCDNTSGGPDRRQVPGPRQTVSHVQHPKRGPGLMVYGHGPSYFLPDDGSDAVGGRIALGGASSQPPRSWLVFHDPEHGRIEADHDGMRGDQHEQMWSPTYGHGWMVSEGYDPTKGETWEGHERFESEDGAVKLRFRMMNVAVGRPAFVEKTRRSSKWPKNIDPEEEMWRTYGATTGEIFTFRKGGPPTPQSPARETANQLGLALEPDKG